MNEIKKHILMIENAINLRESDVEEILYHGTSLKQFNKILNNKFKVNDFYLGDDLDNIAMNYAEKQALEDHSSGVVIYFDKGFINSSKLKKDFHDTPDSNEPVEQIGQYIITDDLSNAVITAFNIETGKRIYMSKNYFKDGI